MRYTQLILFFIILLSLNSLAVKGQISTKRLDEAAYLQKAAIAEQEEKYREASWHINQVAMQRWEMSDYDSALLLFNHSLKLNQKINNQQGVFGIYSNLAMIHADIKEYEKALKYFSITLEGRKAKGEKVGIISAHINIAVVLNNLEKHKEAAEHLQAALSLAREMNDIAQMRSCYGMLSETYEKAGDIDRSLEYFELYRTFHELTQKEQVEAYKEDAEAAKLRAKLLETEKERKELALQLKQSQLRRKEKELAETAAILSRFSNENQELLANASKSELLQQLLESQNKEITAALEAKELRLQQNTLVNRVLIGGVILLLIIAVLIYMSGRARKRQNKKLQKAINAEQKSKEDAQEALSQLQDTQAQLVHQEKMASLGQLTAGIAHEINNPLNFIHAGIDVVKAEKQVYDEVIEEFQHLAQLPPDQTHAALLALLDKHKEEEFEDAQTELDDIIVGVKEGSSRVQSIVQSLQYFSRQRQKAATQADIHQCIDSTLMLLNNQSVDVEITKDYHEELGEIYCYPSQINQVLMNVLVNAIQATENQENRQVHIKTLDAEDSIQVLIADNGPGIAEEYMSQIFNPFFTTKDVGKGTGLGLSISYGIIEEHQGSIEAFNHEDGGASFVITLPKHSNIHP